MASHKVTVRLDDDTEVEVWASGLLVLVTDLHAPDYAPPRFKKTTVSYAVLEARYSPEALAPVRAALAGKGVAQ